ncbi:MAG: methionyl-tRNA formyltransferase [Fimbriimonadaceae bacterium]|nr:methionyl-tRNA formyltransferase [Fimbriimonadaceae bacterium]QYK57395.1 MAG: methionyl-tRNA formyltransferase [Fimbriimonadaceae bacterium]
MTIVYFGTAEFAVPPLRAVAKHVRLVVSQPDRASGRGLSLKPSPVKRAALELGIPVLTPEKARSPDFVETVRNLEPDMLLVAAYGQILSKSLLQTAKHGGINLHGSILPKYRGAAPIQRALLAGEGFTGVTVMQMDEGMDTGDVIATELVSIGRDETSGELFDRLADVAARLAASWAPLIESGDYDRAPQDPSQATYAPRIDKSEAELSPFRDAVDEYNRYRAFTPSPGAFLTTLAGVVKVTRARLIAGPSPGPGKLVRMADAVALGFRQGALNLIEVKPEGKRAMSGTDFMNGLRFTTGDVLVEEI